MKSRYGQSLIQIGAVLAIFILQMGVVHLNLKFGSQIQLLLDFSIGSLSIAVLITLLGVASGIILALLLLPKKQNHSRKDGLLLKTVVLGALPAFAVVLKLILAVGVVPFSPLRPFSLEVWEWAVNSQVPPFWLGLVIGWMVKQLLTVE